MALITRASFARLSLLVSRSRCRGAVRPGYEGKRSAKRRGACEAPGGCEPPGARARRATSPCDRRSAPLGAPLRSFSACRSALACFRHKVRRKSYSELLAHGSCHCPWSGVRAPGCPADEAEPRAPLPAPSAVRLPEDAPQRAGCAEFRIAALRSCEDREKNSGPVGRQRRCSDVSSSRRSRTPLPAHLVPWRATPRTISN
jgi:hypothetical protein